MSDDKYTVTKREMLDWLEEGWEQSLKSLNEDNEPGEAEDEYYCTHCERIIEAFKELLIGFKDTDTLMEMLQRSRLVQ